ncbi:OLC1v1000608C2 [Oldenlandia corymbosa var. corymbosa]|uniref:OLC1v1000608C2 n=1 Tax=Oldenlandia corymbosa var. corymbosa TaxID=529605 RepID=A0AAV1D3M3_OLDCO|nr:OLC1v1000608C2 [Oldenlandia corymbosa var. corymbosa]
MEKGHDHHEEEVNVKEPFLERRNEGQEDALHMVFLSTAVAVCGSFIFGSSIGYSAPAQYHIMEELGLTLSQYSIFGSTITIGAMVGALTCGKIADTIGRKGGMSLSSIFCTFGWIAIILAKNPEMLYLGRLLIGYGIGNLSYIVPVFVGEITPSKLRGALGTLNQLFIIIGLSASYVIGTFVGWRTLALFGLVPCVILLFGLLVIPESPRWLAMRGNEEEFEKALRKLRGPNANIYEEAHLIKDNVAALQLLPKATVMNLFDRTNIRPVFIAVGLMAFQQIIGINGIVYYSSFIFRSAGFDPHLGSILYAIIQVIVTGINAVLVDWTGRRPLLLVSASGLLTGSLLTAISFLLKVL